MKEEHDHASSQYPTDTKPHKHHRRGSVSPNFFVEVNVNSANTGDHQQSTAHSSNQSVEQQQDGCLKNCWKGMFKAFTS